MKNDEKMSIPKTQDDPSKALKTPLGESKAGRNLKIKAAKIDAIRQLKVKKPKINWGSIIKSEQLIVSPNGQWQLLEKST